MVLGLATVQEEEYVEAQVGTLKIELADLRLIYFTGSKQGRFF